MNISSFSMAERVILDTPIDAPAVHADAFPPDERLQTTPSYSHFWRGSGPGALEKNPRDGKPTRPCLIARVLEMIRLYVRLLVQEAVENLRA